MKRITLCLALLVLAVWTGESQADEMAPIAQKAPASGPPRVRRFKISSYGVWVKTNAPGYPAYRYTYRGQVNGDQRPAIFTYGYEHQMQENGPYTLNGDWH